MTDLLFDTYVTVFGLLAILLLCGAAAGAVVWRLRKKAAALEREVDKRERQIGTLEREVDTLKCEIDTLERKLDSAQRLDSKDLYESLQSVISHELLHELDNIAGKSRATLEALPQDQLALREKQNWIIYTAYELSQHASNIIELYAPQAGSPQQEIFNFRRLLEACLTQSLGQMADSAGVALLPRLADIGFVLLSQELTSMSFANLVRNAIKYSHRGGVVEIILSLSEEGPPDRPGKWIRVDVKDTGKGIKEEDWGKIFELRKRADGLVEQGSGIGLHLARRAARRQGGDVVLVSSQVNAGSAFRISLPYNAGELR